MGNCILLITSREREGGKKERREERGSGKRRAAVGEELGGARTLSVRTWHWRSKARLTVAAAGQGNPFIHLGQREERDKEGEQETCSRSGWKGTGDSAA